MIDMKIDRNIVAGIIALIFLILDLAGYAVMLLGLVPFSGNIIGIFFTVLMFFIAYKTLYKKEKLTKLEWVIAIGLFIFYLILVSSGVIAGLAQVSFVEG